MDSDASGSLDATELASSPELLQSIRRVGESDEEATARFMAAVDTDSDGQISFVEFVAAAASSPQLADYQGSAAQRELADFSPQARRACHRHA